MSITRNPASDMMMMCGMSDFSQPFLTGWKEARRVLIQTSWDERRATRTAQALEQALASPSTTAAPPRRRM